MMPPTPRELSLHERAMMARTVYRDSLGLDVLSEPTPQHMRAWEATVEMMDAVSVARLLAPHHETVTKAKRQTAELLGRLMGRTR